ncbi:MAG TPA: PilZ domain-containing protein [Myxococcales bacterium]|nr:PilZ domain-containing protein [Myxococcales bacterium]
MNNRRASERHQQARVSVEIRPFDQRNTVAGTALNLSEGGALVELSKKGAKRPGGFVLLELEIGGSPSRIEAVVQRAEEHRGRARLGLRFVHLGEHERHALRLHLRGS